jgi:DNA polymerase III delta prime subunit
MDFTKMENIMPSLFDNFNNILKRHTISEEIKKILLSFDENINNTSFKKGIYIYGATGSGKTQFILNLLKEMDYDVIKYDAGDVRNKGLIDTITSNNVSNRNVLQMMNRKVKKIVILMDEIDGMNNGDKGGITSLIKLIRQKKTKKQKLEDVTLNPIICIGNYYMDKKMKELMKVCNIFELKKPDNSQILKLLKNKIPHIFEDMKTSNRIELQELLLYYIQGDLRKLIFISKLVEKSPDLLNANTLKKILHLKSYNEDVKQITRQLIQNPISIDKHELFMNETDRTILALLWHENIVDSISSMQKKQSIPFYMKILDNMCYADFIDRITFQNQIWQFNEMSSLMKTFYNNKIFHDTFNSINPLSVTTQKTTDIGRFRVMRQNGATEMVTPLTGLSHHNQKRGSLINPCVDNGRILCSDTQNVNIFTHQDLTIKIIDTACNEKPEFIQCSDFIEDAIIVNATKEGSIQSEIRFTKVLTKYSTEYNNILFIYNMCKELDMDKRDLLAFFQELRLNYGKDFYSSVDLLNCVEKTFEYYNINKLDIKRIYRYLDKNFKKGSIETSEEDIEIDDF